jgi:hypothetical protein
MYHLATLVDGAIQLSNPKAKEKKCNKSIKYFG